MPGCYTEGREVMRKARITTNQEDDGGKKDGLFKHHDISFGNKKKVLPVGTEIAMHGYLGPNVSLSFPSGPALRVMLISPTIHFIEIFLLTHSTTGNKLTVA